jgi:hypothetical protein
MEINLNSIGYNNMVTKEDILQHVTQEDVFSFYMGESVEHLGLYNSPLRDDNIPSFNLYFHKDYSNTIMFKDYATKETGDFVQLVVKLFNLSYPSALLKIAFDFKLYSFDISTEKRLINYTKIKQKKLVELGIKRRNWQKKDKVYWESYRIKKETLDKFNVFPITYVFYNNVAFPAANLAYAYVELKDNKVSYKIYQPLEEKRKKWINNANFTVHQGYTQLPNTGNLLIITKSLKDVMCLYDVMGIPSVGLQSESVMMKHSVMEEYKTRFKTVVCLFDNDKAGVKLSNEFSKEFNIPFILMPKILNVTDFSDYVKNASIEEVENYINEQLNKI